MYEGNTGRAYVTGGCFSQEAKADMTDLDNYVEALIIVRYNVDIWGTTRSSLLHK